MPIPRLSLQTPCHSTLLVTLLLTAISAAPPVWAQSELNDSIEESDAHIPIKEPPITISGRSIGEIEEEFGPPDRKISNGTRDNWYYQDSTIFFDKSRVVTWVDNGALSTRRFNRKLARKIAPAIESELSPRGWRNDWKPAEDISSDQVIDEIVDPELKSEQDSMKAAGDDLERD